jgi:hypothetical protein
MAVASVVSMTPKIRTAIHKQFKTLICPVNLPNNIETNTQKLKRYCIVKQRAEESRIFCNFSL